VCEIIAGKIFFNLLAKTFEISLYKTLYKLIGLNYVTIGGFLIFGIKAIFVIFHAGGITPKLRVSIIA
jgi:hypothetical protein